MEFNKKGFSDDCEEIKGFKVFNPDWTCRGFQYEVGKIYEEDVEPICCDRGFHFCKELKDCFNYYQFNPDNKVAEVIALGEIDEESDNSKCCTNKIQIVREISWQDVLVMVNLGKSCTGIATLGIATQGIATLGIATLGIGTLGIATLGIGTLGIGTKPTFQVVVSILKNRRFYYSISLPTGLIECGLNQMHATY